MKKQIPKQIAMKDFFLLNIIIFKQILLIINSFITHSMKVSIEKENRII